MPQSNSHFDPQRKGARVLLAIVLVVSVSGYFMGLRQTATTTAPSRDLEEIIARKDEATGEAPRVREYSLMRFLPKANHGWSNTVAHFPAPVADLALTNPPSPEERLLAVQQRRARRAFEGAPPVIPHAIDQTSAISCLACHGEGKVINQRVASRISHPPFSNCTQCHVPAAVTIARDPDPALAAPATNTFRGLTSFSAGLRAFPGAPRTIPHPTWMRNDCMSCHGPGGAFGLRTSHPGRQSCTQCHAPSADQDQRGLFLTQNPD